ncbi:geranylgeranyl reductase family protein [Halarchaeum rubridurum]|uniref:Electron transfer flavoprotein n=1 Tax=Halarchaeum rubridurum TaxID=489911 RepID=A0A830G0N7_9EURY|nr:geranylgeranyl reductase family protein [Halarchaeum rubridurum]MBP1955019.1 geranylgeranyl reductase family protein [Halarchaeum rubridurum]GGM69647.1 electron transfer flavoprotein [Halarchaeum rubridurum]
MYDFAVVGVGPPGARFARRAAERGHDVVAFERGEIGKPLACSGHVSLDVWAYVPEAARERLHENDVYGARFHTDGPGSDAHEFYYTDRPVSNAIDRVELDKTLARAAADAGADVRDGHTVTAVREGAESVELDVRSADGDETVTARMVAGCDGPRSRVRDQLALPEPEEFLHGVLAFDPEPDHDDYVDVHLTVPGFFAWRIPRGEAGVEYGLAATPTESGDVAARFDDFVADYGVAERIERRCSGLIPIGPPERVTATRGFLLGDAAGMTKPFTGGGILYGMTAADVAAETVDPTDPATLDAFEDAWRDELGRDIALGKLVRKGYDAPELVQKTGMKLFAGEIGVHMDRPSTLFSREQLSALFRR